MRDVFVVGEHASPEPSENRRGRLARACGGVHQFVEVFAPWRTSPGKESGLSLWFFGRKLRKSRISWLQATIAASFVLCRSIGWPNTGMYQTHINQEDRFGSVL